MAYKNSKDFLAAHRAWRNKNREYVRKHGREYLRRYRTEIKIEVLAHYGVSGKPQCTWPGCDVSDPDMLSLDHVNDDGARDRKVNGPSGSPLFLRLKRDNFPEGFQTLCCNHQMKKEIMRRRENLK